jgi:hypothetical protein
MQLYLLDWLKHPGLTPPIGEPRFTLWHDEQRKLVMGGNWVGGAPFAYLTSLKVTTNIRLLGHSLLLNPFISVLSMKVRTAMDTCYAEDFGYSE